MTYAVRICLLLSVAIPSLAAGQVTSANGPTLSAHEIAQRLESANEKRHQALTTYTSTRTYLLDYKGFPSSKHAKLVVDVHFQAPRQKDFSILTEEGSGLLRNRVLKKLLDSEKEAGERDNRHATEISESNYNFTLAGVEEKDGRHCYALDVKPKSRNKFLYTGRIWVDEEDFAVVHISAQPAQNPSFWIKHVDIEHEYKKFGDFWLPVHNTSKSSTRLGGEAVLTIDYGRYAIGTASPGTSSGEN